MITLNNQIPYGRHNVSERDVAAVVEILRGDWLTTGPTVEEFESRLKFLAKADAVVVSSGTAALHCAYAGVGIKPGDEIITPPLTFIATQATAALLGAKIIFADTQLDTGNIDPDQIESKITKKTKAITVVDYAGHPCEIDEIKSIAQKHGLYLIEDASHSIGSTYKNKPVGSLADLTTFSFFATKNVATGEGGAVVSNNIELLDRARKFGRQGMVKNEGEFVRTSDGPWHQEVHEFGLNYRLPDVLCALGISQLARLDQFKRERTRVFDKYVEYLSPIPELKLPTKRDYVDPMWHLFPLRVPSDLRKELFQYLKAQGFLVQVNYIPAHLHPVFSRHYSRGDFPNAEMYYSEEISLPMFVDSSLFNNEYFERLTKTIQTFLVESKK